MAFDAHKNFAISTVVTPPSPATSGASLAVTVGEGARFPAVPFNATVWPAGQIPTPGTAEVVRVTGRTADTLHGILRAQESSTARAIIAGDYIAATITALTVTDLEAGTNFPVLASASTSTLNGDLIFASANPTIRRNTNVGADSGRLCLTGGGAGPDEARGPYVLLWGNESAVPGRVVVAAGNPVTGNIQFATGSSTVRGTIHNSGGFSWNDTNDPGAGNLHVAGTVSSVGWKDRSGSGGTTSGNVFNLHWNGSGTDLWIGATKTGTITVTSDARLKRDFTPLTGTLEKLRHLVAGSFYFLEGDTDTPHVGLQAQAVETVLPILVRNTGMASPLAPDGIRQVNYLELTAILLAALQELDALVQQLAARVDARAPETP